VVTEASRFWVQNVGVYTLGHEVVDGQFWSIGVSGQFAAWALSRMQAVFGWHRSAVANATDVGAWPV
jgi:hypothetical protein